MSDPNAHSIRPDDSGGSGLFDFYVEQLETYLDSELDPEEAAVVRQRLAQEPAYAATLDRLRHDRRLRLQAFTSTDPAGDEAVAARLGKVAAQLSVRGRLEGARTSSPLASRWWIGSAVAACLVVGFGLGLLGRFDFGTPPAETTSNPVRPGPSNVVQAYDAQGRLLYSYPISSPMHLPTDEPADVLVPDPEP